MGDYMWSDQSCFGSNASFYVHLAGQETQIVNLGKKVLWHGTKAASWKAMEMEIENFFFIAWSEQAILKNNKVYTR